MTKFQVQRGFGQRFSMLFLVPAVTLFVIGMTAFSDDPDAWAPGNLVYALIWVAAIVFIVLTTIAVVSNWRDFSEN